MEELMAGYLANELSEEERAEFEKQLVESEELRIELEDYLNLWTEGSQSDDMSFDKSQAWNAVAQEIKPQTRIVPIERRPKYTFLKIAATLLIVLTAGYFLSESGRNGVNDLIGISSLTEVTTGSEMKEVVLPDGSTVKLNANSTLAYAKGFGESHRNITLSGGANFDVQRNESLPFVIEANNGQVEVLGTSFDVKAYDGKDIELNVTEGTVKFSSVNDELQPEIVNAGEMAMLSADGSDIKRGTVADQNYAAWWTRKLVFENASFEKVIKNLEETYWVEIDFSEELRNCQLTANYENQSLDEVLKLVQDTFVNSQLKVIRSKENQIKLEGKACAN
ncbi:FecR family protein [Roseivirga sp. E12]|uniref:FecR family protein n=1 Tax=Roseivirga sp. E12 TaxID=2819237 RepID=UPI001ABC2360|nr:FecR family protein [Roseivirga sp. E12]MBO3699951.1 FecR domain-containing protein [Roseivirga sp. E12]